MPLSGSSCTEGWVVLYLVRLILHLSDLRSGATYTFVLRITDGQTDGRGLGQLRVHIVDGRPRQERDRAWVRANAPSVRQRGESRSDVGDRRWRQYSSLPSLFPPYRPCYTPLSLPPTQSRLNIASNGKRSNRWSSRSSCLLAAEADHSSSWWLELCWWIRTLGVAFNTGVNYILYYWGS